MSELTEAYCRTARARLIIYLERAGYHLASKTPDWSAAWSAWSSGEIRDISIDDPCLCALDLDAQHDTRPPICVHFCKPTVHYRQNYIATVMNNFQLSRNTMFVFVLKMDRDTPERIVYKHNQHHLMSYFSYDELQKDLQRHILNPVSHRIVSEAEMRAFLNERAVTRHLTLEIPPIVYTDAFIRTCFMRPGDYAIVTIIETHVGPTECPRRVVSTGGVDVDYEKPPQVLHDIVRRPLDRTIL